MSKLVLIGLTGLAGSGKSTVAHYLRDHHDFRVVSFAGPLKAMAKAFGLSDRELSGDMKEVPNDMLCGKTPRQFMQALGTEFGRNQIGNDLWLRAFRRRVECLRYAGTTAIVVDDVRFQNEADLIHGMGGHIIRIVRPGAGSVSGAGHSSEAGITGVDYSIANNADIPALLKLVSQKLLSHSRSGW